jgi:sterol desaturase/sphingolipid hydroxylase (fatty acid hydroxylase superfamily)
MLRYLIAVTLALLVAGAVFTVVERRWPALRGRSAWSRSDKTTDLAYWFVMPLVTRTMIKAGTVVAVVLVALALGAPLGGGELQPWIEARRTVVSREPRWLQAVEVLILVDLLGYWGHRLFHRRPLWRFHAIHHAVRELDWLSSVRVHPVNEALMRISYVVPLFALGFRGELLLGVTPVLTLYALCLHANVPWTFGPLRYVLASPAFHRWHHSAEAEALDKNFAAMFPVWDLLFGTYHLPVGRQPAVFGANDEVPAGLAAQLAWPFRGFTLLRSRALASRRRVG